MSRRFVRATMGLAHAGWLLLALSMAPERARAQWTTQTITLNPGWNAVFLEVQPANPDCDAVFAGLPIESVWAWNRRFSSVQFIQDASSLVPGQPDWLVYLPPDDPGRSVQNLFSVRAAQPYLIKLRSGAAATTWTVTGQPVVRNVEWLPSSLNFVGFNIAPGGGPTFQDFFAGSPAQAGQPIYRLNSSGQWQLVTSPATTAMRAGEAFWIRCAGASTFSGPLELTLDQPDGLLYGRTLTEETLKIKNDSTAARSITIQELASLSPPDSSQPVLAGAVPLSYYRIDAANHQFGWLTLPSQLQHSSLQPGQEWTLRLEVNRPQMASFTPPASNNGVLYQSVLSVSDDHGLRYLLPVSSEGLQHYGASIAGTGGPAKDDVNTPPDPRAGLWVGSAVIDKVSQPANPSSSTNPVPVGTPFQFRLLVHVDNDGTARLLQKVLEMYKNGTLKPDPNNPTNNIIDQPGHYVLVTDDSLIPQFTGATLSDSQPVARRLSTAAFGFSQPIPLVANGAFGSGRLTCQVNLDYDDRLNPFKHLYHPQHDNLDARFQNKLPEGVESFTILRQIEMDFTAQDPDNLTLPGWGDDQLGGNYYETISGLSSQPLHISGTFRLTRVSTIGVLNDGL
jgi:hypothetical protein